MWQNFVAFILAFGFGCVSFFVFDQTSVQPTQSEEVQLTIAEKDQEISPVLTEGRFFMPTSKSDQEVIDFFNNFRRAVEFDDRVTVAAMIKYPVCVRFAHGDKNRNGCRLLNKASFLKEYDKIFDGDYKQFIAGIDTYKTGQLGVLWANWRGVTADRGQFWFEGICNDNRCAKTELKITTLSSGFLQRPYDQKNHIDNP